MQQPETHTWKFKGSFRRNAFGWKSGPAITRIRQAVAEIAKVSKRAPLLAAEGALVLIERLSPALEHVDSSSGSIGTAVHRALDVLVPLIASAPAEAALREAWLERLFEAYQADSVPYIEALGGRWGELSASPAIASRWADQLLLPTREALGPDRSRRGFFKATAACLSALYAARRFDELIELLRHGAMWDYEQWAVRALAATGRLDEALARAESCRSPWATDVEVDLVCEELLLAAGRSDEAYARYGVRSRTGPTYLATFRAVVKRYPQKVPADILADLAKATPGDEGKWFAAAKDAGLHDEALELARRSPCDPKTLARAARDFAEQQPAFAMGAGLLALQWAAQGYGYEITGGDVWGAYRSALAAAERIGMAAEAKAFVRRLLAAGGAGATFMAGIIGREVGQ